MSDFTGSALIPRVTSKRNRLVHSGGTFEGSVMRRTWVKDIPLSSANTTFFLFLVGLRLSSSEDVSSDVLVIRIGLLGRVNCLVEHLTGKEVDLRILGTSLKELWKGCDKKSVGGLCEKTGGLWDSSMMYKF